MIRTTKDIDINDLENAVQETVAKLGKRNSELQEQFKGVCELLDAFQKKESLSHETKALVLCVKILFNGMELVTRNSNTTGDLLKFAVKVARALEEIQKTFAEISPQLDKLPNVQNQVVELKDRFELTFGDLETTIQNIRNQEDKTDSEKNVGDMSFIG